MPTIDDLPQISAIIKEHGLNAKKSLSQNFLLDLNLTSKIARLDKDYSLGSILEVGPGPGGLTRALLAETNKKIYVLEKDERCIPILNQISDYYPGRLEIFLGDALSSPILSQIPSPIHIFSNLPYNIGTELLTRWLDPPNWPPEWTTLTLMFQAEVAERIIAKPGSKNYGRLSILAQWRSKAKITMRLPPEAFTPIPKVHSAVVRIERLEKPIHKANSKTLISIVASAFNQRRKMIRSSLKNRINNLEVVLEKANITPTKRAGDITIEEYCCLSRIVESLQ